ncbi:hypothetical protein CFC21_029088, partial [Triticum aestivum]
VSVPCSGLLK